MPSAGNVAEGLLDLGIASFVGCFFSLFLTQAIRFSSVHGPASAGSARNPARACSQRGPRAVWDPKTAGGFQGETLTTAGKPRRGGFSSIFEVALDGFGMAQSGRKGPMVQRSFVQVRRASGAPGRLIAPAQQRRQLQLVQRVRLRP